VGERLESWRKVKKHHEAIPKDIWQAPDFGIFTPDLAQ